MNNQYKMGGHGPHLMPAPPIFQKYYFFKNGPKNLTKVENLKKKICILGNHFIGLLCGILHVLILLVYPEKLKENLLLLNTFCTPLYHQIRILLRLEFRVPYQKLVTS